MASTLTTPPQNEPVGLTDAKAFMKIDNALDDALIGRLIIAARQYVERFTNQVLISQTWSIFYDDWPQNGMIELPVGPVAQINGLTVYDAENTATPIAADHYEVDLARTPQRLVLVDPASLPGPGRKANGIEVSLVAGFGPLPSDVPEPVRQAMLMLVAHWYENRQPGCDQHDSNDMATALRSYLTPYRAVQL